MYVFSCGERFDCGGGERIVAVYSVDYLLGCLAGGREMGQRSAMGRFENIMAKRARRRLHTHVYAEKWLSDM